MKIEVDKRVLEDALSALRHSKDLVNHRYYETIMKPAMDGLKEALFTIPAPFKKIEKERDPLDIDTVPQKLDVKDLIDRSTLFGSLEDEKD